MTGWDQEACVREGPGVKFAVYFDASNGALRFVPCSQHQEPRRLAAADQRSGYDDRPAVVAANAPGDVIAFDLHTFMPPSAGAIGWPGPSST